MKNLLFLLFILFHLSLFAQITPQEQRQIQDSLFIDEVENRHGSEKILHAEPLYIDLIRDLGARKGEREWNVGLGLTDNLKFDTYETLVEYEWAPVNRLGLEVELPFTFFARNSPDGRGNLPPNRLESLKLAAQWSFLVKPEWKTTMAFGYIHQFEVRNPDEFSLQSVLRGNVYNPFLVMAKRFGDQFHSLLYSGPVLVQSFGQPGVKAHWENNLSLHYMISGTRNFVGIELNQSNYLTDFDLTIRPQMRLSVTEHLMAGIVGGIPVSRENQRLSSFVRLIYEPPHRRH
jgi:hypothetical protein